MIRYQRIVACTLYALLVTMFSVSVHSAEKVLVLVTHISSPDISLSLSEIRKMYLGVPDPSSAGITPIRNHSDRLLNEVFLQKLVFLSARDYDRLLIGRSFRGEAHRPRVVETPNELSRVLEETPATVSYVWLDTASSNSNLKVLKELWRGSLE